MHKNDFPILNSSLIYLDNASTTQKPKCVIDKLNQIYSEYNSNVHRGMYPIASRSDKEWLEAHDVVAKYINASYEEVFFTKNATEGINWLALTFAQQILKPKDIVVTSNIEHHSNYLPWKNLEKIGVEYIAFQNTEELEQLFQKYGERVKLVSCVHTSNVLGTTFDVKKISQIAHSHGAYTCLDGTQSIAHMNIDVKDLDCDFFVFSGHKVYGPNGVGVVYGKKHILDNLEPIFLGGEMVDNVSNEIKYSQLPYRFEAGTPNIADGIALASAITWFSTHKDFEYEQEVSKYMYEKIMTIPGVSVISQSNSPILSFNVNNVHPHDIAYDLGQLGICVRAGYHCAQPLHESLGLKGSVRVSIGIYNTKEDIDILISSLNKIILKYT